ncbi:MAG: GlsB/YeaQ/YmgE family stress response membrane protein [Isosphaeraceae bacterium]
MDIVWFLLIGLAAGWLASFLIKVRGLGLAEKLIVGVIGALIGGYVFRVLPVNMNVSGTAGSLITATVGAAILLFLLKLIRRY